MISRPTWTAMLAAIAGTVIGGLILDRYRAQRGT